MCWLPTSAAEKAHFYFILYPVYNSAVYFHSNWTFKAQWSLYVPPGSKLQNSTFCPTQCYLCFVWISEPTAIIAVYSINWLAFIIGMECIYCAVRSAHTLLFMCFVWISEPTAIIAVYSINWLAFITGTECIYWAVRSAHKMYLCGSENKERLFHCTALTEWFL